MDGPDPPVLTGCSQALRFSPRSCQKSLFRSARAARASCFRETLIPAGPACINIGYRVLLRSLAETSVAAVGPRERSAHSGKNCILVLRKDSSFTDLRLLRTLFLHQLCQLLTTRLHMKSTDGAGQTELGWEATKGAGGTQSGVVRGANHHL